MPHRGPVPGQRQGVAALEFALLAPVLAILVMGVYDITNAVVVWWQMSAAAGAIARIASTFAATSSGSNVLTGDQASTASTAVFAVIPALATAPAALYGVTLSSVVMTPTAPGCTSGCTYVANVAWSLALQGHSPPRPCGPLGVAADGSPASIGALPLDAFTSAPLLVVDLSYDFVPLSNTFFGSSLRFLQPAYIGTRTGTDAAWVRLTGPQAAAAQCPGYTG